MSKISSNQEVKIHGMPKVMQKPKDFKGTVKFLWLYIKKERFLFLFAAIMVLASTFSSLAATNYLQPIIDNFLSPANSNIGILQRLSGLFKGVINLLIIYIISVIASYLQSRFTINATQRIINNVRYDLFNHLQTLSVRYYDAHTHGEIMSRFSNDVDTLNEALNSSLITFFSSVTTIVGIISVMILKSIPLTLLTLLITPLMIFVAGTIMKKSSTYFIEQQSRLGKINGYIEEIITGQKVVKVFSHEHKIQNEFERLNEELRISATKAQSFAGVMMPVMMNLTNINYALISMIGGLLSIFGYLSLGSLVVFLTLSKQLGRPINEASGQFNFVITAIAGAERIYEVMKEEPEKSDSLDSAELIKESSEFFWQQYDIEGNKLDKIPVRGDMRFFNVSFGYTPEKTILKDISLYAKPGQKIAFVGSTGAGKTTVMNLITRFYDISQGQITLDGIDIKKIKKDSLRHALSIVLQDTHLFTGTVWENIRYGKLNATDDEVINAAKLANAHSFISRLPHGYDTLIEGDGTNLSQGQRQLLNIARAAIADAPILILDEATSSIDTRTEKHIEEGLDRLMLSRTTFVIAHRLSTIRNSKAIMVMENGEIIERGTHEDLLNEKGRYYQLYTGIVELD